MILYIFKYIIKFLTFFDDSICSYLSIIFSYLFMRFSIYYYEDICRFLTRNSSYGIIIKNVVFIIIMILNFPFFTIMFFSNVK